MQRIPITIEGAQKVRDEVARLKKIVRPQISQEIAEARSHGDLKENAEYHAAKDKQGLTEARINLLEGIISNMEIINVTKLPASNRVVFGTSVTLYDFTTKKNIRYKIVGDIEADLEQNRISILSPIAKAIIGKEAGEEVKIQVPSGEKHFEILEVEYK